MEFGLMVILLKESIKSFNKTSNRNEINDSISKFTEFPCIMNLALSNLKKALEEAFFKH